MEQDLLEAYIALLIMAVIPIYFGSYRALNPSSVVESITQSDAMMFPVFGSAGLFGLYLLFKFLSKEWINFIFSTYYGFIGIGTISTVLVPVLSVFLPYYIVKRKSVILFNLKVPYVFETKIDLSLVDVFGLFLGSIVGVVYFLTKNWIANNIFGECISIVAIEIIALKSYWVGAILLILLFFYDIFWVFGTDVMETVARSFEAPIKVLWPRGKDFSLLGLGDIVIPGLFVSLMLKFDRHLEKKYLKNKRRVYGHRFPFYFTVSFIAYILSLVVTVAVLHIFKHGQPALLYIVPFLLISTFVAALLKGELKELILFHVEEKKDDKKEEKDDKKEEKKGDKKEENEKTKKETSQN